MQNFEETTQKIKYKRTMYVINKSLVIKEPKMFLYLMAHQTL